MKAAHKATRSTVYTTLRDSIRPAANGVHGPVRVTRVEPGEEFEAYNLAVADFSTYFVGDAGVLVHDITPRQPTRATVPGLTTN